MKETIVDRAIIGINILVFFQILCGCALTESINKSRTSLSSAKEGEPIYPGNSQTWFGVDVHTKETCIKFQAALQVSFKVDKNSVKENVSTSADSHGSCDEDQQYIELHWQSKQNETESTFILSIYFEKGLEKLDKNKYVLNAATFQWNKTTGENISGERYHIDDLRRFETSFNRSFKCLKELSIEKEEFTIHFSDLQFEAFHLFNDEEKSFDDAEECPNVPDKFADMGKRLVGMISLLLGCVLVLFFLSWILYHVLKRQWPVQFGYHSVN